MSKAAAVFLILALASGVLTLNLAQETGTLLPAVACAVFASLFVAALVIGRKIKFDPVLR